MEDDQAPCRVVIGEYLSIARRLNNMAKDSSKDIREFAENLICTGL